MCTQHLNKINIIAYNVGSLISHAKRIDLNNFLKTHKPDFLLASETHLSKKYQVYFEHYTTFRNDNNTNNTGTAIFLKNSIKAESISVPGLLSMEVTLIEIKLINSESLLIGSIYNKCNASAQNLKHDLDLLLPTIKLHTYSILGGDFNARHSLWNDLINSPAGLAIANWLQSNAIEHNLCVASQHNPTFTRSDSILDFFLATSNLINIMPQISNFSCNTLISDSDHLAVQLKINLNHRISFNSHTTDLRLNFKKVDWNIFKSNIHNNLILNPDFHTRNLTTDEIDLTIKQWRDSIISALNQQASSIKKRYKYKDLPANLIKLYEYRSQLRKKLNRTLTQYLNRTNPAYRLILSQINCLSTLINQQTKNFMNNQFYNRLKKIIPGPDSFKSINKIIGRKITIPDTIYNNSTPLRSSSDKAEAFANHFENNFNFNPPNHLPEFIDEVNRSIANLQTTTQIITNFSASNNPADPIDQTTFTNLEFIESTIQSGKNKKSCGPDGISSYILKKLPASAILLLTIIINNCINHSYFPTNWKTSIIIPLPKKGSANNIKNFRPISLIDSVSKIFEKVILDKISNFCEDHNIVQNNQFGFKKAHGTLHTLIKFQSDVTTNLNKKEITAACFLDVEKAFDSIWIYGLVFKIRNLGFPNSLAHLILNYLSNRKFVVKVKNLRSQPRNTRAGVPQGSVLGSNLFNLFNYDQPSNDRFSTTLMYADDTITYASSISPIFALDKVKTHIVNLLAFYRKWGMKINLSKSEILFIRNPSRNSRNAPATACRELSLSINNEEIVSKRKVKYLGILFSELFKFNNHVNTIINRAMFAFHLIHPLLRIRLGLPTSTKLLMYKQLIRPIITYGFPIWFTISKLYIYDKIN